MNSQVITPEQSKRPFSRGSLPGTCLRCNCLPVVKTASMNCRRERGRVPLEGETREFDSCLHIGSLLAVMQSKARRSLKHVPSGQQ